MPNYPYSFQLPPLNVQDIPNDGVAGEFLGISAGGVLDWLPVSASGSGDMLKSENLSGLADYAIARTNIGLGLTSSPEFANLTLTSPSLASSAPVTISQTWGNSGQTFKALVVNAAGTSDANSAAGSLLLDLQVGTVSQFSVSKDGQVNLKKLGNSVNASVVSYDSGGLKSGFYFPNSGLDLAWTRANGSVWGVGFNRCSVNSSARFSWSSSSDPLGTEDTILLRDGAANTLALRNGTAAQTFNVYGTYTSGTSYERLTLSAPSAANAIIGTNKGSGGGTARGLDLHTDGAARMTITTAGNVGIGTTAPGSALTISGALGTNTTTYDSAAALKLTNTSGNSSWLLTSGVIGVVNASFSIRPESSSLPALVISNLGNVGIGTTSPTSKLHVAETWNAAGTTFAAAKIVVTDTASAAASNLLELWSDAITPTLKYSFGKSGVFKILGGNNSEINCNQLVTNNGTAGNTDWGVYLTNSSGIILKNTLSLGWSNGVATLGADTILLRDGEQDHLAMRRSTNGQKFSVYGTYPGANWERFTITAPTSGNVLLGTYKGTGGIARGLELQADGTTRMLITAAGAIIQRPLASVTPPDNGDLVIEATSNTTLTFKLKGTDGTVRTGTITLA